MGSLVLLHDYLLVVHELLNIIKGRVDVFTSQRIEM
jgi:hypothetical protein